jgi:hypothetical protein
MLCRTVYIVQPNNAEGFALSARALKYLSSLQYIPIGAKAYSLRGLCATRA